MKLARYWNTKPNPIPALWIKATADEISSLRGKLPPGTSGSLRKGTHGTEIAFSGKRVLEVLALLNEPLGVFENWKPMLRPTRYLPDSVFIEEAKKYAYKQEWRNKSHWSYLQVRLKRKHLWDTCTAHMQTPLGPVLRGYQIYAYEFPDNHVYVGLTCNPAQRHENHKFTGSVFAYAQCTGLTPLFIVVTDGLTATAAALTEEETVQCYRDNGWTLLNRRQTGALGTVMMAPKHTYESVLELARPFACKSRFNEAHNGAYQFARKHGWMQRITDELGWKEHAGHVWDYAKCLASAKRYDYQADWAKAEPAACQAAHNAGFTDRIKQAAFPNGRRPCVSKYTREACEARARCFATRTQWQYGCHDGSYGAAKKNGWHLEIGDLVFGPDRASKWLAKQRQLTACACGCGVQTRAYDAKGRPRRFDSKACRMRALNGVAA